MQAETTIYFVVWLDLFKYSSFDHSLEHQCLLHYKVGREGGGGGGEWAAGRPKDTQINF